MGLFDFLKGSKQSNATAQAPAAGQNSTKTYVDASSVSLDERPFYQPDSYYTFYSNPGSPLAFRVVPFEERKQTTYPSRRGLYVAEILLLEYCKQGKYPKPSSGYPGFWWFRYGIRDVGHALESLERRGFIRWAPKTNSLHGMKVEELKQILTNANLPTLGKKSELISRISTEISDQDLVIPNYVPKYELTELGMMELEENGYVPYMHNHNRLTTEDARFGETFTVWDMNRLFPNGDATNWRQVVGNEEKRRFGVDVANSIPLSGQKERKKVEDCSSLRDEMRRYLAAKQTEISMGIHSPGDGFEEESQGLDYKATGQDKEALVKFYIAIGKKFDAPALYRETANLLHKYGMFEEELSVIELGLKNVSQNNRRWSELMERKKKVEQLLQK